MPLNEFSISIVQLQRFRFLLIDFVNDICMKSSPRVFMSF